MRIARIIKVDANAAFAIYNGTEVAFPRSTSRNKEVYFLGVGDIVKIRCNTEYATNVLKYKVVEVIELVNGRKR